MGGEGGDPVMDTSPVQSLPSIFTFRSKKEHPQCCMSAIDVVHSARQNRTDLAMYVHLSPTTFEFWQSVNWS